MDYDTQPLIMQIKSYQRKGFDSACLYQPIKI